MKRIQLVLLFLFVASFQQALCSSQDAERTASTLYNNHQYQQALELWTKMVDAKSSSGLFFNIGLAQSRLHNSPEAIYAFEQALRLRPLNVKYAKALKEERKKIDNPVIPLTLFFLERWYLGWITCLRPGTWAILGLLLVIIAVVTYLLHIGALPLKREVPKSMPLSIGFVGLIFMASSLFSYGHLYRQDEGILMNTCELKQASSPESPVLRSLSGGEKVRIKDRIGEWNYVALLNLDYGWIKSDCIKLISIKNTTHQ